MEDREIRDRLTRLENALLTRPGYTGIKQEPGLVRIWHPTNIEGDLTVEGSITGSGSLSAPHEHPGSDITSQVGQAYSSIVAGNADMVDGQHATDLALAVHTHTGGQVTSQVAQAANADTVDNLHAATSGANAHVVATDAGGNIATSSTIHLAERAAPGTPGAGWGTLYQNTDGWPRLVNDAGQVIPMGVAELIVPITSWHPASAAPITPVNGLVHWGREFRDNTVDAIDVNIIFPLGWRGRNLYLDVSWCCSVGTGNVWWVIEGRSQRADAVLANTLVYNPAAIIASPGYFVKTSPFSCGAISGFDDFSGASFRIYRYGTHANDTAAGTAYVLATRFRVV